MHSKIVSALAFFSATALAAPTSPVAPPLPSGFSNTCNNVGYTFSLWQNAAVFAQPYQWDPSNMDSTALGKPDFTGTRSKIGLYEDAPMGAGHKAIVYDSKTQFLTPHMGIQHKGYFFSHCAGKYTVSLKGSDDATYFCVGKDCTGKMNQSTVHQLLHEPAVTRSITVDEGYYVPFEVRWANVRRGPYNLDFTITDPLGNVILGAAEQTPNLIVNKLCNAYTDKVWNQSGLM